MYAAMKFELAIEGINPASLIEIEGDAGPFYVCTAGGKPELENCFFYGDDSQQFFFYANVSGESPAKQVVIFHATTQRLSGAPVRSIDQTEALRIVSNIKKLFSTRKFHFPGRPLTAGDEPASVNFTWKISR